MCQGQLVQTVIILLTIILLVAITMIEVIKNIITDTITANVKEEINNFKKNN